MLQSRHIVLGKVIFLPRANNVQVRFRTTKPSCFVPNTKKVITPTPEISYLPPYHTLLQAFIVFEGEMYRKTKYFCTLWCKQRLEMRQTNNP
jgi:hypothetical protein